MRTEPEVIAQWIRPDSRVLDLGCGDGTLLLHLAKNRGVAGYGIEIEPDKVRRVIACSGKVAYDLIKRRDEKKAWDVAIVRVEQLYPFPHKAFAAEMKHFPNATEVVWCQDEPQNQGAWFFVQHYIHENMLEGQKLGYAGLPASASPAVGYSHLHQEQQKALLDQAFGKLKGFVLTK